jgi:uncharacterized protein YyaL (SSP411 family)
MATNANRQTNRLIHETSPYLLQHAHNPVDWHAWGAEALEKAQRENKLLLISIGYSACHWCHVMERESFENEEIASLMNGSFVCIKVDREERPDVDQVYMNAVQLVSGQGGWPLNCFALPDGRPVYGGTYYRPEQWRQVLMGLAELHATDPAKVERYAEQLTSGVRRQEWSAPAAADAPMSLENLRGLVAAWKPQFDRREGGANRAPKFPLPNNWQFLLRYARAAGDAEIAAQVRLTLDKMAFGGIYDHLGGGFARYSTDGLWKVPHFEKMLYDNGQLLELYAEAYQATGDPLYAQVARETAGFVARELTSPEGVFYSALDADSEGVEGKYYVWSKEEIEAALGADFALFRDAFNINSVGYWEDGNYIPLRKERDAALAEAAGLSLEDWRRRIDAAKANLMAIRSRRVRPGLDDKSLTAWNALMSIGYLAAYRALGDAEYLQAAEKNLGFILTGRAPDGALYRSYKAGRWTINAFLEDYACMAEALCELYQATFEGKWLSAARELAEYALAHFLDADSGLCFFTSDRDPPLVARKFEIMDNVTPAGNSSLAKALHILGTLLGQDEFVDASARMLAQVRGDMPAYLGGYSNWAMLALRTAAPCYEVVIAGPDAEARRRELARHWLPDAVLAGSVAPSDLPLLEGRFDPARTRIYVCRGRVCDLPSDTVAEALARMNRSGEPRLP